MNIPVVSSVSTDTLLEGYASPQKGWEELEEVHYELIKLADLESAMTKLQSRTRTDAEDQL